MQIRDLVREQGLANFIDGLAELIAKFSADSNIKLEKDALTKASRVLRGMAEELTFTLTDKFDKKVDRDEERIDRSSA